RRLTFRSLITDDHTERRERVKTSAGGTWSKYSVARAPRPCRNIHLLHGRGARATKLCLIVLLICQWTRADFTFIHCSDVHVGAGNNAETDAAMFREIAALDPQPAFALATGDICENGTDAQYAAYQDVLKNLGDVKM